MATITVRTLENYQILATTENHAVLSDEPKGMGDGLGPGPYELLLAALGSCTAMTVLMYARRKGWTLESVRATLAHGRVHTRDCEDCEQEGGFIEQITVQLHFEGDLDEEQRARLGYIATRCPVRKTLGARPQIVDEVV